MKKIYFLFIFTLLTVSVFAQKVPKLILPVGHTKEIVSVAYTPDGRQILTSGADNVIKIWESETGKEINTFKSLQATAYIIKFSPDGKTLAAGFKNGNVMLWDFDKGELIANIRLHSDSISSIDFFANDKLLTASKDRTAKVYDIPAKTITTNISEGRFQILSASYYPQGDFILTGGGGVDLIKNSAPSDSPTKLWNINGRKISDFAFGIFNVGSEIHLADFTPDGQYAIAVGNGQGRVYDMLKNNKLIAKFNGLADFAVMSPNGKAVLMGGDTKKLQLIDIPSGKVINKYKTAFLGALCAAFSPDGNFITVGLKNKAAVTIDARSGEPVRTLASRSGGVLAVTFSPYGKYLATGSSDGTAKIWDVETGGIVKVLKDRPYIASSLSFSPDNKLIAVGNAAHTGTVFSIETGEKLYNITGGSSAVVFSPDGKKLLAINNSDFYSGVFLYESSTGKMLSNFAKFTMRINAKRLNACAVFSPDGKLIYIGGKEDYPLARDNKILEPFGEIQVWDAETGKFIKKFQDSQDDLIMSMDITKDGKTLVTSTNDKSVGFWNTTLGLKTSTYKVHDAQVSSISYSPDQTKLLTASYDKRAKLIDVKTMTSFAFTGHEAELFAAKFAPDGKYMVTGSMDNTTRIWSTLTYRQLATLIPIDVTEWLVITPEGYFDGSEKALKTLYFSYNSLTVPLEQLKDKFYRKGLLPIVLGYQKGDLPLQNNLAVTELYPGITLNESLNSKNPVLSIRAVNSGGGIGKIKVLINGKIMNPDVRSLLKEKLTPEAEDLQISVPLASSPLLKWGQKNEIEVVAYNGQNTLSGPPSVIHVTLAGKIK